MILENTPRKQCGRPFQKGQSGNPNGRPKGARNRSTIAAELLLDGEAKALTRKAIDLALGGDTTALRLCLERLVPPKKDRAIALTLPAIRGPEDLQQANAEVLAAVAEGRITPSEAREVMGLIENCRKGIAPAATVSPLIRVAFVTTQESRLGENSLLSE